MYPVNNTSRNLISGDWREGMEYQGNVDVSHHVQRSIRVSVPI